MSRSVVLLIVTLLLCVGGQATTVLAEEPVFGGVGLQVVPTIHGELVVLNVLAGAPAEEQGLVPGDLIFKVNDFPLRGSEFGRVISEYLWGPVGSTVELFYRRPGLAGDHRLVLKRSAISPQLTVTPSMHNNPVGAPGEKR